MTPEQVGLVQGTWAKVLPIKDTAAELFYSEDELRELVSRADSQCIPVPENVQESAMVLNRRGLPVWPNTEAADIVRRAARITVDEGLFVPARTLSVAAARMNDTDSNGIDVVQAQFIRSLSE